MIIVITHNINFIVISTQWRNYTPASPRNAGNAGEGAVKGALSSALPKKNF